MPQNFESSLGKIVKNLNGSFYIVFDKAINVSDNSKEMILLKFYHDTSFIFVIPSSIFLSKVDKQKFPDALQEYNFQLTNETIPKTSSNIPQMNFSIERDSIDFKGKIVRDLSSNIYEVITVVLDGKTGASLVLYKDFYNNSKLYVISKSSFLAKIDKQVYPDTTQKYNFEVIPSPLLETISITNTKKTSTERDFENFRGRVVRHFKGSYYLVINNIYDGDTNEELVLYRSLFDKYDFLALPKSFFLGKLNSKLASKYKKKYIYELVDSNKIPKRPSFKEWLLASKSPTFKHNLFWIPLLIILFFVIITHLSSLF